MNRHNGYSIIEGIYNKVKKEIYQNSALGKYLLAKGETAYDFLSYSKLDLVTIYKAIKGNKVRIDTARRIVRVTKGAVTLEDMGYGLGHED